MANNNQKQFGAESPKDGDVAQAKTKSNKPSNNSAIDPDAVLPKKKSGQSSGKKATLSPVMQVMKAVTAAAINPKKKKSPKGGAEAVKTDKEKQKLPNTIYKNQG